GAGFSDRSPVAASMQSAGIPKDVAVASVEFGFRAGVVTTSCLIVNALTALVLRRGLASYTASALDELAALSTPALEAGRVSTEAVQIGGTTIPAGETVICILPAANRDLLRSGRPLRRLMTFGGGLHRCSGEALAREEVHAIAGAFAREGCGLAVLG